MDTKQKNRPQEARRSAPQGAQKSTRRPVENQNTAHARPAGQKPQAKAPARRTGETAGKSQRQRPAEYGRAAAPQGTGPRKSAPQPKAQERPARKRSLPVKEEKKTRTLKQNSLQNFISGVRGGAGEELDPQSEQAKRRRQRRSAEAARKRRRAQMHDTPAVIYTAPRAFNWNRLLVQLLTVTAVVLALIMSLSVFFKVETITVSGAEKYSKWAVREASGIKEGDNLLTFSIPRASGQIIAKLSYVDKVRIGIKLPDTVNIYIEELDVAYAIKDSTGTWWLMTSEGRMVEQTNGGVAADHTQILGVTVEAPEVNEFAVATELPPTETDESGELVPVTVTGAQRLSAAMQILKALEANDIVGEAASVDVTRLEDIILWYGTRYQVNLGGTGNMEYKIACMNDAILQLSDYQTGVLDVSFNYWKTQVGYTPFE